MVFYSTAFLIFFVAVFFVYWIPLKRNNKAQNIFLLLSCYIFYGYADIKMLPILAISTILFYYLGIFIANTKSENTSRWLKITGIVCGVGLLFYFKYLNFFIESFSNLFTCIGIPNSWSSLNIIMPLGVSFYTFRLISYVIDVHNEEIEPTKDVIAFATYVSFFPCILSGPIDKPSFIKQLQQKHEFNYNLAIDGTRQFLWGLFKKLVVADNCARYVYQVFLTYNSENASTLILAAIICTFQIYADFSGYSDMAIGIGKLFGFKITENFKYPLFALNIADFWRRWHISLTSWLTDYVFTPLNFQFRRWYKLGIILAIIINMIIVGIWHGANWTYIVFGLYHGLLFIPLIMTGAFMKKDQLRTNKIGLPVFSDFCRILLTFSLVAFGVIIFNADNINIAWGYISGIFNKSILSLPYFEFKFVKALIGIFILITIEWFQRNKEHGLVLKYESKTIWNRLFIYYVLIALIILLGDFGKNSFIYFQY